MVSLGSRILTTTVDEASDGYVSNEGGSRSNRSERVATVGDWVAMPGWNGFKAHLRGEAQGQDLGGRTNAYKVVPREANGVRQPCA